MLGPEKNNITILSLLDTELDYQLRHQLRNQPGYEYRRGHGLFNSARLEQLQDSNFWSLAPVDCFDVILVQADSEDLRRLTATGTIGHEAGLARRWSSVPAAVVAVLKDGELQAAIQAAMLDFDGILACPYDIETLNQTLPLAVQRHRDRSYLAHRYGKLRRVCREVNRRRRNLRQKVDLLCSDLVGSNQDLTETLRRLRDAYGFQNNLMGEFDMHCMLHKALLQISGKVGGCNSTFYSCISGQFEAHISSNDEEDFFDITGIEDVLAKTIVDEAMVTKGSVFAENGGVWESDAHEEVNLLEGMSLLACPISVDGELVGVMVLYRRGKAFDKKDLSQVETFLSPFGRVLATLTKLSSIVG